MKKTLLKKSLLLAYLMLIPMFLLGLSMVNSDVLGVVGSWLVGSGILYLNLKPKKEEK